MRNSNLPKLVFGLLAVAGLIYFSFVYQQLPDLVASHFNAAGVATAWMPKSAFFFLFGFVMLLSCIPAFLIPGALAAKSDARINLPNKEYWLAPERRAETMTYLANQMGWFGCALLAFLLCGFAFAVSANLGPNHAFNSNGFYIPLAAFLIFSFSLPIRLLSHFRTTGS